MTVRAKAIVQPDKIDYMQLVADMSQALEECAYDVHVYLTTMPGHKTKHLGGPLPGGFYSSRQMKHVMKGIKEGYIVVPYQRSGDLVRSWTVGPLQKAGDALSVEIYQDPSLAPYGPHVQDPKVRPAMHDDWPTPDGAKQALEGKIVEKLKAVGRRYGAQ